MKRRHHWSAQSPMVPADSDPTVDVTKRLAVAIEACGFELVGGWPDGWFQFETARELPQIEMGKPQIRYGLTDVEVPSCGN